MVNGNHIMDDTTLPEGYQLDQAESQVPAGYSLDQEAQTPAGYTLDEDKYSTPGQKVLTAVEGFGRGLTAGLTDTLASGMRKGASFFGVPEEYLHYVAPKFQDIAARQEQNPITSTVSEVAGNIGLMSSLPQIGSRALNGMLQTAIIAGGDELSKAMLGHGDPIDAVASHIAESGAVGFLGGALFGKAEKLGTKALEAIEKSKVGNKLPSFLSGIGHAASFPGAEAVSLGNSALTKAEIKELDEKAFRYGQKFFNSYAVTAPKAIARIAAPSLGGYLGGWGGAGASIALERGLELAAPKVSQNVIGPALLKAAATGTTEKIGDLIDHATKISKGAQKISKGVEALFESGADKFLNYEASEKDRQKLREFIESGGINKEVQDQAQSEGIPTQNFAQGGNVEHPESNPIARVYPEQNTLMATAKGRVSGYLNSIRPVQNPTLPFDSVHKDKQKNRDYEKALDLANQPLRILKHIKDGTLSPKHLMAFNSMYPELHSHLSKKITQKMTENKTKDSKKPPYKTRQALSLFLGSSLDSTLTPASIQASQMVFAQQKAQRNQPSNLKSLSKMGQHTQTAEQGRIARLNKS